MANIERTRGDTVPFSVTFLSFVGGTPVDLTGYSVILTVDPSEAPPNSSNNIMQLVASIPAPTTGEAIFKPSAFDADHVGVYFYDVQITDINGDRFTPVSARFRLKQDISKS